MDLRGATDPARIPMHARAAAARAGEAHGPSGAGAQFATMLQSLIVQGDGLGAMMAEDPEADSESGEGSDSLGIFGGGEQQAGGGMGAAGPLGGLLAVLLPMLLGGAQGATGAQGVMTALSSILGGNGAAGAAQAASAVGGLNAPIESAGASGSAKNNASVVARIAREEGVDPALAVAMMLVESGGNNRAVGDGGTSFGLFQLHEGGMLTAAGLSRDQAFDPATNARVALRSLAHEQSKGYRYSPGQLAAASQRPADKEAYAAKIEASLAQARSLIS